MYSDKNMEKDLETEYTMEEIKANPDKAGEMLKHNKKVRGRGDKEKEEWVSEGLSLRDKYIEPPFSILDTKTGSWQQRKRKWLELGIKSEEGRNVKVLPGKSNNDYMPDMASETSIFDPALCELMYKWFCPDGGVILDPFAGGSVRGIMAHKLGYKYIGIELRPEQVESNRKQALEILPVDNQPTWICGDSEKVLDSWKELSEQGVSLYKQIGHSSFDMIFSCPPYANLEIYSDLPDDLSNMDYKNFMAKYEQIIKKSFELLDNHQFAVFVVGDVRNENGYYLDFVGDTKRAFMNMFVSGKLYNDMVLLDPIGTAMIRASNFKDNQKVVKIHQNVLCFKKI